MRRRWLAPEVVQTSALDCGPAALKSLLQGLGIPVGYDRLREACQTDLDGTSIDAIEEVAVELGLAAEQVMLPCDHLELDRTTLPAIVVVRLPQNLAHFVLAWRKLGPFLQIMDPATGRRWVRVRHFLSDVYVHRVAASGEAWKAWAGSSSTIEILAKRLAAAGIRSPRQLIAEAARSPGWQRLATLDAAARLTEALIARGALRRRAEAERLLAALLEAAPLIPARYWNARPCGEGPAEADARVSGAVLVRVAAAGRRPALARYSGRSPEVAAAVNERRATPFRDLFGYLRPGSALTSVLVAAAFVVVPACLLAETLLFRAAVDFRNYMTATDQRLRAIGYVALFGATVLLLEHRLMAELLRFGRLLEARFRVAWLTKLAGLDERYFRSRLVSDMAERTHAAHYLHDYPHLIGRFAQAVVTLALVSVGIALIQPASAVAVGLASLITLTLAFAFVPAVQRHDVKVRTYSGALARFYLDALRGVAAIRAHSGEAVVRREHESLLVEWHLAGRALARSLLVFETLQATAGFVFATWLVKLTLVNANDPAGTLLITYWAFTYPRLAAEIATIIKQQAEQRSVALRLIEPLAVGETQEASTVTARRLSGAAAISMRGVTVRAGGHTVLRDIDLDILPGEHVAIVGASGAGKSSLVGLLLGWQAAAVGEVEVDGRRLTKCSLAEVRAQIAWVDPMVNLWNESLECNVTYGARSPDAGLAAALDRAGLYDLVERLSGLQAKVGEEGGLLSGGEGQRVRLARGLMRTDARIAILDEAFRGLDHDTRRSLLETARAVWRNATLLCVTHDIHDTLTFDRVFVLAEGALVEHGKPQALACRPGSRYAHMLRGERETRLMWSEGGGWRRLRLEDGEIAPQEPHGDGESTFKAHVAAQ